MDNNKQVIFEEHAGTGWIILNRPEVLNALSLQMVTDIYHKLIQWSEDKSIFLVCIKSKIEKSFCSGGDIRSISEMAKMDIKSPFIKEFFTTEYKMDLLIHNYTKPILVFMNGLVMGGGVGISIGAKYRIMTEKTKWAMPEMNIGFFPDVGAGYFLNQMPGYIGTYLALTANVITEGDLITINAADYYIKSSYLSKLEEFIKENEWRTESAEKQLKLFLDSICSPKNQIPTFLNVEKINLHFQYESIEEILLSLNEAEKNGDKWAKETKIILLKKSPTSLKVTLELLLRGKNMTLEENFETDIIIAQNFLHTYDFHEGVRAVLIDKDQTPKWNPECLNKISCENVKSFFQYDKNDGKNMIITDDI